MTLVISGRGDREGLEPRVLICRRPEERRVEALTWSTIDGEHTARSQAFDRWAGP